MSVDPRAVLHRTAPEPDGTVCYGNHPDQIADFRLPATSYAGPPLPLVIVIHGGFWRAAYDRRHTGPLAADLAARGYPVAQLEYRRTGQPGGGWPGTFDDVEAGIAALPTLLAAAMDRPELNETPPILLGHSAGGQLALWCARSAGPLGVLALAPVSDLAEAYRLDLGAGAVTALLGGGPDEFPERYGIVDPARHVPVPVRTVIVHGALDVQVPIGMSRRFVAVSRAAGAGDIGFFELSDAEHFGLIDPESPAWPTVAAALRSVHRCRTQD